jgi:hypothetical protein
MAYVACFSTLANLFLLRLRKMGLSNSGRYLIPTAHQQIAISPFGNTQDLSSRSQEAMIIHSLAVWRVSSAAGAYQAKSRLKRHLQQAMFAVYGITLMMKSRNLFGNCSTTNKTYQYFLYRKHFFQPQAIRLFGCTQFHRRVRVAKMYRCQQS